MGQTIAEKILSAHTGKDVKVGELVTLALSSTEELPRRLISTLNDMILEDDIDVGNFHDKEVEELTDAFVKAKNALLQKSIETKMNEYEQYLNDLYFQEAQLELERGYKKLLSLTSRTFNI